MPPAGTQPRKPAAPSVANKEANEYIPSYISKKPFYVGEDDDHNDYLEHQRLKKAESDQSKWYDRGKKLGPAVTKFRKGACENCGAMTHKTKECLSRPRAKGARWTGKDIQADEVVQDVSLGWDAKRDRWNGYDAKEYKNVVDEYAQLEELKRHVQEGAKKGDGDEEDEDDDGAKYAEESDMGWKPATSTRQLRIREDTAKYLLNLDLDSAKYDPKSRSMVNSGATADTAAALVAEEGFMRTSGDAGEFEKAQMYAWEAQEKTGDTKQHLQGNPTAGEYYRKKEKAEAETKKLAHQKMLLEKYGGEVNPLAAKLREAAVPDSERYVEYDESGAIKGAPRVVGRSKYPEDVHINNHTSVWGSWWSNFQWGYSCCHSILKNSYCIGLEGKTAFEEANRLRAGGALASEEEEPLKELEWPSNGESKKPKEDEATSQAPKKRTMEEMKGGVTEEDMDEYRRKRTAANDPMAAMLGKDKLL
ncbi:Pre-mRNA splicing Prp18-interacting factor-domain-containing protein [Amylocarpus encephaloides]|uniref:Pre-mRNA-splicing factor SLU7 n=1 Tax=Amylocarpus encephaloides TaxID=45428 RepID=A0A9P7Y9W4_9HELO|nr:Pre-mRNA splicing Prp18-interacting factor-domain-containing protein [Amylocarpus encephaloides]